MQEKIRAEKKISIFNNSRVKEILGDSFVKAIKIEEDKEEKILREMKEEKREKARFWIDLPIGPNNEKQKVLIEYYALKDSDGKYLGCMEASRNITDIQLISGEKRLLD